MADWYASSTAYAAVPVWAASTAYTVGQFVKPTAPATGREYVFRCTVAGTSGGTEPTWSSATANNSTIISGGATFTNVTGQSAYGWSAAAGKLLALSHSQIGRPAAGDRIYVSSDNSETTAAVTSYNFVSGNVYGLVQVVSVNRAGSVPPAAADVQSGAVLECTSGTFTVDNVCDTFWQGFTFRITTTSTFQLGSIGFKALYFKNCAFVVNHAGANYRITQGGCPARVTFDNTTVQFGATSQQIAAGNNYPFDFTWLNTPSALQGATFPASLFFTVGTPTFLVTLRGVDLSAVTGNLLALNASGGCRVLLESCRIASGLTRLPAPGAGNGVNEDVELVNCYDGTNVLNERYTQAGAVTTDRATAMSGGAQDDNGAYSHKMVSSSRADRSVLTLDSFTLDVGLAAVGSSKTATVEIVSSASLNNDDISLLLEYMGTSGSPVASFASSLPATVLTTATALASSSASWSSPPGTPVYQKLQLTFTPQRAGRLRGVVKLGKPSTTVWVDPVIRIT